MSYRYRAVEPFWTSFYRLGSAQKESARRAWDIFKLNPFDPRLRTHKIHGLSARLGRTIYSVWIEKDLRALFYLDKDVAVSIDIGQHRIYRE